MALAFAAGIAPGQSPASSRQQRLRDFLAERRTADGSASALARENAQAQHAILLSRNAVRAHSGPSTPLTTAWQPLGPSSVHTSLYGNVTGRVTAIAFDSNDTSGNTVYLGTTGGGVWKSTTAAGALASVAFAPLTDTLPVFSINAGSSTIASLSIGAIAVQPTANPVVLAGTGDPNDATDSLYGEGILRSTDGGQTWTIATLSHDGTNGNHLFAGLSTAGLAWSSASANLVVAAMSVSPQAAIVDAAEASSIPGLYYSTDAGVTWHMSTLYDGAQIVQQPQPPQTGQIGNAATSVVWDAVRGLFIAAVRSHGYYSSRDGVTWMRLATQPGLGLTTANCPVGQNGQGSANCPIFRGMLAAQPTTGDLYALTIDANDNDQGLWQDLCNATSGSCASSSPIWGARIDNGALEIGSGNRAILQGSYNLSLAAAPLPSSGTLLFAGTVDLYRCAIAALSPRTPAVARCATQPTPLMAATLPQPWLRRSTRSQLLSPPVRNSSCLATTAASGARRMASMKRAPHALPATHSTSIISTALSAPADRSPKSSASPRIPLSPASSSLGSAQTALRPPRLPPR